MINSTDLIDPSKVEEMVMQRFPFIPTEKTCQTEKRERNRARQAYRTKLYAQYKEQQLCQTKGSI